MNSKILFTACLAILSVPASPSLFAQQASAPAASQSASGDATPAAKGAMLTPQDTVERMSTKLNLTDEQKAKITPIIADRQTQMKSLLANPSGRRLQMARQAKSIMDDSNKKIEAVLTKDQKKTYEQMKDEMREQMRSRMQERNQSSPQ